MTYASPVIVAEPEPVVDVKVGKEVRLGVVAEGVAPLSYQWSKDGQELAGLEGWLAGEEEEVTLLAPSDPAIGSLAEGQWAGWLEDEEYVGALVRYHMLAEGRRATEIAAGDYETLNGATVTASWAEGGILRIN